MKRIICLSIALMLLLTGCFTPAGQMLPNTAPDGNGTYGVYKLDFTTEYLSGWPFEWWEFVYTHNNQEIKSGYQVLLDSNVFTFESIRVDVIERDNFQNVFTGNLMVAISDGGSGKTEIMVTNSNGKTTAFKVTCRVTQVGGQ